MGEPERFTKPCQVIGEGYCDKVFIRRLTSGRKIAGHVGSLRTSKDPLGGGSGSGRSGFGHTLQAMTAEIALHDVVRGVVLMADNDDDPDGRFADVVAQIREARFPAPTFPEQVVDGLVSRKRISLSVLMIPSPGVVGTLESLLLQSLPADTSMTCADDLMRCADANLAAWPAHKRDEAKLRAVLATSYQKDPGRELGQILFDKRRCPFDMGHAAFDHVDAFLRTFLRAMGITI